MRCMKRPILLLFTLSILSIAAATAADDTARPGRQADWRAFLQPLTGAWELTGTMGTVELHQRCEGGWILQKNFFRMECRAVSPDRSGYRAVYIIGYHTEKEQYLFHLFDTFGGDYAETIGRGVLNNNRIVFEFDYPQGAFRNTFVRNKADRDWKMVLRQKNEQGEWELFSEKVLTRPDG